MIDCKRISQEIKQEVKLKVEHLKSVPTLEIIQVGDNKASNNYVRGKISDCKEVGIKVIYIKLEENITEQTAKKIIKEANNDISVNGIIVQLPLPPHINKNIVKEISEKKDVDGFLSESKFTPCTPKGVLSLLNHLHLDIFDKIICMVGYGELVNKPLFQTLSNNGATVIVCRSHTSEHTLKKCCKMSDIIISAVGKNGLIKSDYVNFYTTVIDCGIDIIEGKQYGDCEISLYEKNPNVTPRVGGMGLMTRASLLENILIAYNIQN